MNSFPGVTCCRGVPAGVKGKIYSVVVMTKRQEVEVEVAELKISKLSLRGTKKGRMINENNNRKAPVRRFGGK